MKKFKDALGVFVKQEMKLELMNHNTSANGAQLSEFGESLIKGKNHHFYTLLSYFVPQNEVLMSNSLSGAICIQNT